MLHKLADDFFFFSTFPARGEEVVKLLASLHSMCCVCFVLRQTDFAHPKLQQSNLKRMVERFPCHDADSLEVLPHEPSLLAAHLDNSTRRIDCNTK